jgi:hypothetical protein
MPKRRLRHDASDQNPVSTTAGYAAGGLVLSLAVQLGSLAGFQPPGGNVLIAGLNGGIFPLVLAMIIIAKMLPGTTDVTTDNWRFPVFPGCPPWMNYMARGFYIYALANFARLFLMSLLSTATPTLTMSHSLGAGDPSIASWRGFSSMWMSVYSTGLAILATARRASKRANGHSMAVGAPVNEKSNRQNSSSGALTSMDDCPADRH